MGTYTMNYNLFMPSVGEQGWGELVNGNFTTIDTTMAGLNTRIGTAETNITSLTTRMGTAETTIASNVSRVGTAESNISSLTTKTNSLQTSVNNLSASIPTTIGYSGTFTIAMVAHGVPSNSIPRTDGIFPIYCSSVKVSGKVYLGYSTSSSSTATLVLISNSGSTETALTTTAKEYTVSNVSSILIKYGGSGSITFTIGKPVFS